MTATPSGEPEARLVEDLIAGESVAAPPATPPDLPERLERLGRYDELQRNAVLKACDVCAREFFFTDHAATCRDCRDASLRQET